MSHPSYSSSGSFNNAYSSMSASSNGAPPRSRHNPNDAYASIMSMSASYGLGSQSSDSFALRATPSNRSVRSTHGLPSSDSFDFGFSSNSRSSTDTRVGSTSAPHTSVFPFARAPQQYNPSDPNSLWSTVNAQNQLAQQPQQRGSFSSSVSRSSYTSNFSNMTGDELSSEAGDGGIMDNLWTVNLTDEHLPFLREEEEDYESDGFDEYNAHDVYNDSVSQCGDDRRSVTPASRRSETPASRRSVTPASRRSVTPAYDYRRSATPAAPYYTRRSPTPRPAAPVPAAPVPAPGPMRSSAWPYDATSPAEWELKRAMARQQGLLDGPNLRRPTVPASPTRQSQRLSTRQAAVNVEGSNESASAPPVLQKRKRVERASATRTPTKKAAVSSRAGKPVATPPSSSASGSKPKFASHVGHASPSVHGMQTRRDRKQPNKYNAYEYSQ